MTVNRACEFVYWHSLRVSEFTSTSIFRCTDCFYYSWKGPEFVRRSPQEANGEFLYYPIYGSPDVQDLFFSWLPISYQSFGPSRLVSTNRDATTQLESGCPSSRPCAHHSQLSQGRLPVSVDDCFCGSWNETLLKLCNIFHVSEGVCVLFLVRVSVLTVACVSSLRTGYLLLLNYERPFRLETDPEVRKQNDIRYF